MWGLIGLQWTEKAFPLPQRNALKDVEKCSLFFFFKWTSLPLVEQKHCHWCNGVGVRGYFTSIKGCVTCTKAGGEHFSLFALGPRSPCFVRNRSQAKKGVDMGIFLLSDTKGQTICFGPQAQEWWPSEVGRGVGIIGAAGTGAQEWGPNQSLIMAAVLPFLACIGCQYTTAVPVLH